MTWNPTQTSPLAAGKQVFVSDLKPKDVVRTTFLVRSKALMQSKNGKPYLAMSLGDRTGVVDTRVWDAAEQMSDTFQEGDVVAVAGKAHLFQERLQLVVEHLVSIPSDQVALGEYIPASEQDVEELYAQMLENFRNLECPNTRRLAMALLEDPEIARRYKVCPAAKTIHHAFLGGLLSHSLQLIKLCDAVLPFYPGLNRSILLFGAAFHDFGKIFELVYENSFSYSDEGKLVGHIAIGVVLIDRKLQAMPDFPKSLEYQLKHLVLSHHGRLEYGSPKRPHTLEAQLLHHLDDMDSKLNSIQTLMVSEKNQARWTGHHRAYDQYYYKPDDILNPPSAH